MPKTRINCPNCRQPIVADIDQLFDVGVDPAIKQQFLSGAYNLIRCQVCGYEGMVAVPIVYHDPQKELLLTYVPQELNLPRDEQERVIGGLINQIVNRLPQEQRKGYLLRPQASLTMRSMGERILEADGITREMIQAQQQRLNLLQRLVDASDDVLAEIVKQEDQLIDADFFNLLNRLIESAVVSGDEESAKKLVELQEKLLPITTTGRQLQERAKDVEEAVKTLQAVGKELTREKLLDLVIHAPNDTQVEVIAGLTRPGMDYTFFQILSERIDRARGAGRDRLIALRERLLELTRKIDDANQARAGQARQLLDTVLKSDSVSEATQRSLPAIDEFFEEALEGEFESARKSGDLGKISKLQDIKKVIEEANAPPPDVVLINDFLVLKDEQARKAWLEAHRADISQEFMDTLTGLLVQSQLGNQDEELVSRLQTAYRSALRFSMEANLR